MEIPSECPAKELCQVVGNRVRLSKLSLSDLREISEDCLDLKREDESDFRTCRQARGLTCVMNKEYKEKNLAIATLEALMMLHSVFSINIYFCDS